MLIDLHTHTIASDGQYTPLQLVDMAKKLGIELLSITDHDTVAGLAEAQRRSDEIDLNFIPGIEISCQDIEEIHILGYGIDVSNPELLDASITWLEERSSRGEVIKNYLSSIGIDVDLDVVKSYARDGNLGRPHFARYLVETGVVENRKAAFDFYLDTPKFKRATNRKKTKPVDAIKLIHGAGGKAVLAHPGNYRETYIEELVRRLLECGLDGIECFYSRHSESQTKEYLKIINRYDLMTGCGSDFHGEDVKPSIKLGMELAENYREVLIV